MPTPPTSIHDTGIFDAQQRPANGVAIIQWSAFTDVDGTAHSAGNLSITVTGGILTTALWAGCYAVEYELKTGLPWLETWIVPVSTTPVTVSECVAQSGNMQGIGGGPRGLRGFPGPAGSNGQPGPTGTQGQTGAAGPPGSNGQPGATGQPGSNGQPGATGQPGSNGQPGPFSEEYRLLRCYSLEPATATTTQLAAGIGQRCTLFTSGAVFPAAAGNVAWMQLACIANATGTPASGALQDATVEITIDGIVQTIDAGTFFLLHGEPSLPFTASDNYALYEYTTNSLYGAMRRLFIPWTTHCTIVLINNSAAAGCTVFSQVYWYQGAPPIALTGTRRRVWHMAAVPITPVAQFAPLDLCNITGRGQIDAIHMLMFQFPGSALPTFLEGNMQWIVDGQPAEQATGTEDFFGGQYYWGQNKLRTNSAGVTKCGAFGSGGGSLGDAGAGFAVMAYRIFERDPLIFNTGCRFTWHNGQLGEGTPPGTTYASALVFYHLDQ